MGFKSTFVFGIDDIHPESEGKKYSNGDTGIEVLELLSELVRRYSPTQSDTLCHSGLDLFASTLWFQIHAKELG